MTLWNNILEYHTYDSEIADAALHAIKRDLWYLIEKCVVFSLFSTNFSMLEKQIWTRDLLKYQRPTSFQQGFIMFPVLKKISKSD